MEVPVSTFGLSKPNAMKTLITIVALLIVSITNAQNRSISEINRKVKDVNRSVEASKTTVSEVTSVVNNSKELLTDIFGNKKSTGKSKASTESKDVRNTIKEQPASVSNKIDNSASSVELYDLILVVAKNLKAGNWNMDIPEIKWNTATPVSGGNRHDRNGIVSLKINGAIAACQGVADDLAKPCHWNITCGGTKAVASLCEIYTMNYSVSDPSAATALLFPKAGKELKEIERYDESVIFWYIVYELTEVNKSSVFIRVEFNSGSATAAQFENTGGDSFSIKVVTNKKDAL